MSLIKIKELANSSSSEITLKITGNLVNAHILIKSIFMGGAFLRLFKWMVVLPTTYGFTSKMSNYLMSIYKMSNYLMSIYIMSAY